jgi:hypothetical protein
METIEATITRQTVPVEQRGHVADALFGNRFPLQFEPCVFTMASELSPDYHGGYWEFYALSNGGFYMAPDADAPFSVRCRNGYEDAMSADALGITASLYAYSHLSFAADDSVAVLYARQYHLLRDYMMNHPEVEAILGATD